MPTARGKRQTPGSKRQLKLEHFDALSKGPISLGAFDLTA